MTETGRIVQLIADRENPNGGATALRGAYRIVDDEGRQSA